MATARVYSSNFAKQAMYLELARLTVGVTVILKCPLDLPYFPAL